MLRRRREKRESCDDECNSEFCLRDEFFFLKKEGSGK